MPNKNRIILSQEQARKYSYNNVINYNCIFDSNSADLNKWDPAKYTVFADIHKIIADYYVDPNLNSATNNWFKTVQGAVDQAVRNQENLQTNKHIYIELGPGTHNGLVYIPTLFSAGQVVPITIFSRQNDSKNTTICSNIDAEMTGKEYASIFADNFATSPKSVKDIFEKICRQQKNITTANASVLRIENNEFRAFNFTVQNTYNADRPPANATDADLEKLPRNKAGQFRDGQHQGVAIMVAGADKVHLENLRLLSFQDTLYLRAPISKTPTPTKTARTYIRNCYIEGDVDFIFGQAIGYFSACKIRTLNTRTTKTWVAAPATNIRSKYGFVFDDCDFVSSNNVDSQGGVLSFGRQWFEGVRATPYGNSPLDDYTCKLGAVSKFDGANSTISQTTLEAVGKCVIMNSKIGGSFNQAAMWDDWNGGVFTAQGKYIPAKWHPRFRPVQHTVADFVRNLKNWHSFSKLDYSDLDLDDVLLGEYNNYYVTL